MSSRSLELAERISVPRTVIPGDQVKGVLVALGRRGTVRTRLKQGERARLRFAQEAASSPPLKSRWK